MPNEIENKEDLIRRFAFNAYQIRMRCGFKGDRISDWMDGIKMYEDYCALHDILDKRKL